MTSPAMGTITFSERVCIMENMLAFHPCGVCPTSAAIVPTFSFTSPNIVDRLPLIAPIKIPFIHSLIASSMLCIGLYPRLTEQAGEKRNKDKPNRCNAAARHELLHTLAFGTGIVITIALQEVDNTPNTQARAKSDNKDRKSTRLNSSHANISYAVFCLK